MDNPRRANGHRRNQVRRRVLAEEHDCWLCGEPVDQTLTILFGQHSKRCANQDCTGCVPHPWRAEVDEVVPVSGGGDPLDRNNCHLAHRTCNQRRGNRDPGQVSTPKIFVPIATARTW